MSVFIPIPKKGIAKEFSNYPIIALISHASEVTFNLPSQASTVYEPWNSNVQAGFRKGRETRDQIANICLIIKKVKQFQKNIYFCFIDYSKAFACVDHNKLWKIFKELGIPSLYISEKNTIFISGNTINWSASWDICMQLKKQQLELDMEQQTGS